MRINHNISAMNTYGRIGTNTIATSKSLEKLSSGSRINRASDDAAGLAISEKMRGQIRGLNQASRNAQDAISMVQTAEGGAAGIHSMLQRSRELAVQSANGTLTDNDRSQIQAEISQIIEQVDVISNNTEFNTIKMLNSSGGGASNFVGISQAALDDLTSKLPGWINDGLVAINSQLGIAYPATQRPMEIAYYYDNSTLTAASMGTADLGASLELRVNLAKFFDGSGNLISEGQVDTMIAHEMVHALEFTETSFITDAIPWDKENWFMEGLAVAIQGGNGFLPIDNIVSLISPFDGDYGSDYEAVKVLHEITNGGINAFIDALEAGQNIEQAFNSTTQDISGTELAAATGFSDFADVNSFISWFNNNTTNGISAYLSGSTDFTTGSGAITTGGTKGSSSNLTYDQTITNGTGTATVNANYTLNFTNSTSSSADIIFMIGANAGQTVQFQNKNLTSSALGISTLDLSTAAQSNSAISNIDTAISAVSSARSYFGAIQNRLEHTIANLDNSAENLTAAEASIRDVDMAKEMMEFTKNNILSQAAQAMIAQANQQPQGVLQLLR